VARRVEGIGHALMLVERERTAAEPIDLDPASVVHRALLGGPTAAHVTRAAVAASLASANTAASVRASALTSASLAVVVVFARAVEFWPTARLLVVNRWIHCRCAARTAAVLLAMRDRLQAILRASIARPAARLPDHLATWRAAILRVFADDCR
ncbi:hypothetical protein H4R21_006329, partial [Coemansia helicoidea]